ncbi:MAG TPA: anti-sigma factor [Methylomirabilota bacterium]|jgi:hypothetical protein|nr:anti-sigma factor [Methylomirabilota bacterium]
MTCSDTRELFSALADDALAPGERDALQAHLAGCAECRRELAGFERTLRRVRAMDPGRAPAGFVERVLAAARPEPWPRRLARRLFVPWPKVPLGVAAGLLIAGLAVLLFRGSPEQQVAARYEGAPPAATGEAVPPAPAPTPAAPAATREPAPPPPTAARDTAPPAATPPPAAAPQDSAARQLDAPKKADAANQRMADQRASESTGSKTLAAPEGKGQEAFGEALRAKREPEQRAQAPAPVEQFANKQPEIAPKDAADSMSKLRRDAPPPVGAAESQRRERAVEPDRTVAGAARAPAMAQVAPLSRTGPMTGIPAVPPDVTAQLRVADPAGAERALLELAARVGGRQTGRRIDDGRVAVEVAVPRDAYAQFVREAAALGALAIDRQTLASPTIRTEIRLEPQSP